jgi:DNA invertase Pin-like site-specific DNA recombinase
MGKCFMLRCIAYVRVSTRDQGNSGFGFEAQEAQIRGFAQNAGYRIKKIYREVGSARGGDSVRSRQELQEALRQAKRNRWPVLVASFDRLSRDASEIEDLVAQSGIKIISVSLGPDVDPVVIRREAAKVHRETEMLSARTREGIHRAKQQGKVFGNRTNLRDAQRKGAAVNRENARKRAIELEPIIHGIRQAGAKSAGEIADQLNQAGFRTTRGQAWTAVNVRRVISGMPPRAQEKTEDSDRADPRWGMF